MGIAFTPKVLKNGEFQDTYDRDRRQNREKAYQKLDTEMIGLVKKKKKVKPGYKKKFSGRLMKNVAKNVVLKIVLRAALSVRPKTTFLRTKSKQVINWHLILLFYTCYLYCLPFVNTKSDHSFCLLL